MIPIKTSLLLLAVAFGASRVCADETKTPAPDTAAVTVSVNPNARPVAEGFIGLSYDKNEMHAPHRFTAANTALVRLLKGLGPGVLRIGGATSDSCDWESNGTGGVPRKIAPADVERLAGLLNATGWKCIYGLNLGKNTAEHAAEEAVIVARILKDRLQCFQIGNEPDMYAEHGRRPKEYVYNDFIAEWTIYADAVAKAVPGAVFAGPDTAYKMGFVLPMAKDAKERLSLLTNHYYVSSGNPTAPESTIEYLLTLPSKNLEPILGKMRQAAEENSLAAGFRIDEINTHYGYKGTYGKAGLSDAFASGLWAADTLFTCAEHGAAGLNFHTGGIALFSPILHDFKAPAIKLVRPEFYGFQFFTLAARGVPMTEDVKTTGGKRPLRVHAFADKGGVIRIALTNVNPSGDCATTLELPADIRGAESLAFTAPALDATDGVLLGGAPIGIDGTWNPKPAQPLRPEGRGLRVVVPAASALLVTATTKLPDSPTPKPSR